jgi:hypothetical protein|tara:strand:+ start:510 stop:2519 length:2010 start_codon:yes stop_codon:yes gene_type:complete
MDINTSKLVLAAAGGAALGDPVYIDDLFKLYDRTGNDAVSGVSNGIDFAGDGGLVIFKHRNGNLPWIAVDTERGSSKYLSLNTTNQEQSFPSGYGVASFNSDGFTLGLNYTGENANNYSQNEYMTWSFKKAPKFFDVVTYTGNGNARNIAHSLGISPGMIWIKCLDSTGHEWAVYHRSTGATKHLHLQSTDVVETDSGSWNDTEPTATHFTVGSGSLTNHNGHRFVAYIFGHGDSGFGEQLNEGVIKCGSYTGNGSSDGPEINLGFEPQFVMVRCATRSGGAYGGSWMVMDSLRGTGFNIIDDTRTLAFDETNSETRDNNIGLNFTHSGFKLRTNGVFGNVSGGEYIYMAIARTHKPPTAGTEVFEPKTFTGTGSVFKTTNVPFAPDLLINTEINNFGGNGTVVFDKLRLPDSRLVAGNSASQATNVPDALFRAFNSNGVTYGNDGYGVTNYSNQPYSALHFRRAPGFFDIVTFTGDGLANRNIPHKLNANPELLIVKKYSDTGDWYVYYGASGMVIKLNPDTNNAAYSDTLFGTHTSTTFQTATVTNGDTNTQGEKFLAYMFASLSGISKVGTFSGSSYDVNVDCGFTSGARFILIKRIDADGDWFFFDTAQGISAGGNDNYRRFNTTDPQGSTDYVDPYSTGFTVKTTAGSNLLNGSGKTFLFLAIA